jgi:hypothetical protein
VNNGMFVTDLDGTLIHGNRSFAPADLGALEELRARGVLRVIATGRSLFSARQVLDGAAPDMIDYLIFSSGAGIVDRRSGRLLRSEVMSPDQVRRVSVHLLESGEDFMVHRPIPDNHFFVYYRHRENNPDFFRRLDIYRELATPHTAAAGDWARDGACQVLVVLPPGEDAASRVKQLGALFPGLSVVRATSPIDGRSTWIELFPRSVSKAQAAEHLRVLHGIPPAGTAALGNDYNDEDLLDWARRSYMVDTGPDHLARRYTVVTGGLAEAVRLWLEEHGQRA